MTEPPPAEGGQAPYGGPPPAGYTAAPPPPYGAPGQPYGAPPPAGYAGPPPPYQPVFPPAPAWYRGSIPWRTRQDDTFLALVGHLSFFSASWVMPIAPLAVLLTRGRESGLVRLHAAEALNFHLSLLIAGIVTVLLAVFVTLWLLLLLVPVGITGIVWSIQASVAAGKAEPYRYPLNLRMVR